MKPTRKSPADVSPLLVFGAHPDDIEFGCGGVVIKEARAGRPVHLVVCSRGEAGSHGTPAERTREAKQAAKIMGATIQFVDLDGDAQLEIRAAHAMKLAGIIRKIRPSMVLAPSLSTNQHPDHWRLGCIVRDAARLARFGGLKPLASQKAHAIEQLFYYAPVAVAEPCDEPEVLIDISEMEVFDLWNDAMMAHQSQVKNRRYVELQVARARVRGLAAGVEYAMAIFPNDSMMFDSLSALMRSARQF